MNKNVSTAILFAVVGIVIGLLGVVVGFIPVAPATAGGVGAVVGIVVALTLGARR